jgi:iron uptake system EfeUOB component EfeO/EfeM
VSSPRTVLTLPLLLSVAALAGCGTDAPAASSGAVAVTATDTACGLDRTSVGTGNTTFAVKNSGAKVTEVYVYGEENGAFTRVVGEVENIGPGTSRDMTVDLAAGTYEVACKPGQEGDGVRTRITVA